MRLATVIQSVEPVLQVTTQILQLEAVYHVMESIFIVKHVLAAQLALSVPVDIQETCAMAA